LTHCAAFPVLEIMGKATKTSGKSGTESKGVRPARKTAAGRGRAEPAPSGGVSESSVAQPAAESVIELAGDLRIAQAAEVFDRFSAADRAIPLTLDATSVTKVDAAGLQAVLAALLAMRKAGGRWRWHNPSVSLCQAAELLDLKGALELP